MISIVMPLFNERENVLRFKAEFFPDIKKLSEKYRQRFEVIFVDDGSRDDTLALLKRCTALWEATVVVPHGRNRGMGAAIKTGICASNGEVIVTMDSDLTYKTGDIERLFLAYVDTDADCISGSPYLERSGVVGETSLIRILLSKMVNLVYQVVLLHRISCVSGIFRLYKRSALESLTLSSDSFEINAEIMTKLIICGKSVVEVPVQLHQRQYGESKLNIKREVKNNFSILYHIVATKYLKQPWLLDGENR